METKTNQSFKIIIIALVISFFVGGLSGGFFGYLASEGSLGDWFKANVLGQKSIGESFQDVDTAKLTVEENSATIEAVNKVNPAVVSVIGTKDYSKYFDGDSSFPFRNFFFSFPYQIPEGEQEVSGGTGFIISADGLILTNKHVVEDEETDYSVVLNDGNKYEARVVAKDPANDIAFLKIEVDNLTVAELGDSDSLQIGQTVIAIGNALGEYRNTVTKGIISGLSRTIQASSGNYGRSETLENTIQTDAAINQGNSGGPLINLAGQVIGINTAISLEGQLVGFAIPINQAKADIESIQKVGKIIRPYLGIRYLMLNESIKESNNLSVDYGALLVKGDEEGELAVIPGSPADKAGLEENDIILEFGGVKVDSANNLSKLILQKSPDEEVALKFLRTGEEKETKVTLGEWEAE